MKSSLKRFLYNLFNRHNTIMNLDDKINFMVDFTINKPSIFEGASWTDDILPYIKKIMLKN
jgi:hypothetical protein